MRIDDVNTHTNFQSLNSIRSGAMIDFVANKEEFKVELKLTILKMVEFAHGQSDRDKIDRGVATPHEELSYGFLAMQGAAFMSYNGFCAV